MARILYALVLALATLFVLPAAADEPPRTYTLTSQQAQDYLNRLSAEMRQLEAQHQADKAILDALLAQDKPKASDDTSATEGNK